MRRKQRDSSLIHRTTTQVRFSEVDMMGIAWHGNYVKYLEDGREDFGRHFGGIGYMDIYRSGFKAPIVELYIDYKIAVTVGECITVETRYINCEAAKIMFDYTLYNEAGDTVLTASTTQVFLDENNCLSLVNPPFYLDWKARWNVN